MNNIYSDENLIKNYDSSTLEIYKNSMIRICDRLIGDKLSLTEIEEAVQYSISKRYTPHKAQVNNNYTHRTAEMDLMDLADEILNKKIILTTQGVLFARHGSIPNPFYNLIQYFLDKRAEAKNEMKKHPKGSEEWIAWNLKQNNYKVSCNAIYGCAGNYSSIFYNLYLCTAITGQGRGCISASITMFEAFLSNNTKFGSLTEVLQFIDNISEDLRKPINNKFKDEDVLDRNISIEECFLKIIETCGYNNWIPSDSDTQVIWKTINNLSQREINVLYYKNNLYKFCDNTKVSNLILTILTKLEEPFLDPNKVPKEVEFEMKMLLDLMYEYVYYRHIYIDKLERVYTMIRDIVLITDTDSCIITLDGWYRYVAAKTIGIPMKIKYTRAQIDAECEKMVSKIYEVTAEKEYDFYNDKLVDTKRKKYPLLVIEEDSLRYSIVNIMSYVISQLILDYMLLFSENYNTYSKDRKCLLIMKNEFLFKSLLLTHGAKNYASLQLVQEGNLIPENKQFDIKGLPMAKVGIPDSTKSRLQNILEYDILRNDFVDTIDIVKKLTTLDKEIYESIKNKKTEYHKPARIKAIQAYKDPMRIQGIKASVAYNKIKSKDEPVINLEERNTVLIIKTYIDSKNIEEIIETMPDYYLRIKETLESNDFKGKIESIAIPFNMPVPDWIIPFIDYRTIIQDNLRSFPLDELGISKLSNKSVTYSNILEF